MKLGSSNCVKICGQFMLGFCMELIKWVYFGFDDWCDKRGKKNMWQIV